MRLSAAARGILLPLAVAVAYIAAARFGFTFAFATKQVTAVWPPTGIAVAALVLCGFRVWPGIWVGAFFSNVFSAEPLWTAAIVATGNTAAPVVARFLLQRFGGFRTSLERLSDVFALLLLGSAIAMTVSATNGVIALALARIVPWSAFSSVWWVWWTGDAMGVLIVAPLLLTWLSSDGKAERSEGGPLELAVLSVILVAASWASFLSSWPLRFSVYPFVIWAALRFRQRETTAAIAVVSGFAIWATAHGFGPWATGSLDLRLIQLDSWMAVFGVTGLILGAVTAEKRSARAALSATLEQTRHSVQTLQAAFLPSRLPIRPGLECDALYIAAERGALIGGDWYDAFELPDRRILFSIGDVTGHGLDAAVTAAHLRQTIFATAFDTEDPAELLDKADRILRSQLDAPATAVVGFLSPDLATMSYASAGHPPPIVAGPNTPAQFLECGGLPFGVGPTVAARAQSLRLEPGSILVFYTDGLTEFRRNIASAESAALRAAQALIDGSSTKSAAAFVQKSVMGSHRPADDTVILVARVDRPQAV